MAIKDQGNTIFTNGDQISFGGTTTAVTETKYHTTTFTRGYDYQAKAYGLNEVGDGQFEAEEIWKGPLYGFNNSGLTNTSAYVSSVDTDWLGSGPFVSSKVSWGSVSTTMGSMTDPTYTYYFPSTTNFKIEALLWGDPNTTGGYYNNQNILMLSFDSTTTTGGNPIPNDRDRFYAIRITPPSGVTGGQATTWFRHQAEHSGNNSNDTTVWWWHPTDTQIGYLGTGFTNISGYTLEVIQKEEEYFDGLAKQFGTRLSTGTDTPASDSKLGDYERNAFPTNEIDAFDRVVNEFGTMNTDVNHVLGASQAEANMSDFFSAKSYKRGTRDKIPVFEINPSTSSSDADAANWTRISSMTYDPESTITTPSYTTAEAKISINIYLNREADSTDGTSGGTVKVYAQEQSTLNTGVTTGGSLPTGSGSSSPIFTLKTVGDDHTRYYYKIEWSTSGGGSSGYNNTFSQIKYITGASSDDISTSTYTSGDWVEFDDVNTFPGHGRWYMNTGVTLNQSAQNTTGTSALYLTNPILRIKAVSTLYGTKEISLNGIFGSSYNRKTQWTVTAQRVSS